MIQLFQTIMCKKENVFIWREDLIFLIEYDLFK